MQALDQTAQLRERITDEIFMALGMSKDGFLRRRFGGLFRVPAQRFSDIFASADAAAQSEGLQGAGRQLLQNLSVTAKARGMETLPSEGPLVVASNHPGAYDSAALVSCIPRRDLKIIVYEVPFYHALEHISRQMIFVSPNLDERMPALRSAVEHLRAGGALLQFGTGHIDPDPSVQAGSEESLANWSPSLEIMLRKAPETRLSLAMASGVLMKRFARHPLTRLRRGPVDRRRIAEFMQIIWQLVSRKAPEVDARISFAPPVSVAALQAESTGRLMESIERRALALLDEHLKSAATQPG